MNAGTRTKMDVDGIDRILASEEEIAPSSGFLAATMERVCEEAAAPAPIPFPWARAIPGMLLAAGVLGWGIWEFVLYAMAGTRELAVNAPALTPAAGRSLEEAGWVALALVVSYGSWALAARMMRRSSWL